MFPIGSVADVIHFKSGKKIKVESAWVEGNKVNASQFGGIVIYKKSEIARIETDEIIVTTKTQQLTQPISPREIYPARSLAEKTYRYASEHPYNPSARQKVIEALNRAREIDNNEAEVFLTEAIMILQDGFKKGEWYKASSFIPGTVDKAIEKVNTAIDADPNYSKSHSVLAWFYIMKTEYSKAEKILKTAYQLDKNCFYYWLYRGTLSMELKNISKAQEYFSIARNYAKTDGQKNLIFTRKRSIARLNKNVAEEETLYIEEIDRNPNDSHKYGDYAGFLLCQGRFDEAIEFYTKAIEIEPYPQAILWLNIAKMRNESNANCKNNKVNI